MAWPTRFSATALLALAVAGAGPAAEQPSTRQLVERATAYVATYQQQLTSIIADESYTQEIRGQSPVDPLMPRSRHLSGEVFFMFADGLWMTIRDPTLIDGRPLRGRPSLREALSGRATTGMTRDFIAQNSRWNIGRIMRNFNEPTLALQVVDPKHVQRFRFTRQSGGRLGFKEKDRPTLIQHVDDGPVYAEGYLDLAPDTGVIRRTELRVKVKDVRVTLTTDYILDPRLDIAVPSVFHETYLRGQAGKRGEFEHIACQAIYSNYRRFDVLTRIK